MRSCRAEAHHTEHNAQGHAVEGRAHGDVVGHIAHQGVDGDIIGGDHQAVYAHVHNSQTRAVLAHEIRLEAGIPQNRAIAAERLAVEPVSACDAQRKEDGAEGPHNLRMAVAQMGGNLRHCIPGGLVQQRSQEESQQPPRQGGRIEIVALMYIGRVADHSRGQEAHAAAYNHG